MEMAIAKQNNDLRISNTFKMSRTEIQTQHS